MKRIVYSVWNDITEVHDSVTPYKESQFKRHRGELEKRQSDYAKFTNADYMVYTPDVTTYADIQFYKLIKMQELSQEYDEVLYLDLDVIPKTNINIFENFDTTKMCVYNVHRAFNKKNFRWELEDDNFHPMSVWVKCALKKSMLLLDDLSGTEKVANTGVVLGSKESIKRFDWIGRFESCIEVYKEACEDNLYPEQVSRVWTPNNEAFFSYIIEKYDIPMIDIGISWNYILDAKVRKYTDGAHFIHQVNKEFEVGLR